MNSIQIYVSHRIDINSELVDNPLYIPMRCGAVFDQENPMGIAGDDTGDNISERRMSFCEFTVQYWAWKNIRADYCGLCHYRRYLSFSPRRFRTDEYNMVYVPSLTPTGKARYGLLDRAAMAAAIEGHDGVASECADVTRIPTPKGPQRTVRDMWEAHYGEFFEKSSIDLLFTLIDELAPEYSQSAREYFNGGQHRGFNCFVLRWELFDRLCRFQFPIMFEAERRLDTTGYTQTMKRTPAFLGEMLYGIFMYHITVHEGRDIQTRQLVFFSNTERIRGRSDLLRRYVGDRANRLLRAVADPILPKGSQRREKVKDIFYRLTPIKRRGVAAIKEK
ncbi:DUF4422 domain-containing protein [Flavonifractor plautii]|uniref:DUF4422 domain-containing protein n=1 Tax=Flavonifractor plautii TaxID=292800 RepID=UPI0024BAB47B|nr:DUF4422 domain-containing protein [Flavonifractor plautii]